MNSAAIVFLTIVFAVCTMVPFFCGLIAYHGNDSVKNRRLFLINAVGVTTGFAIWLGVVVWTGTRSSGVNGGILAAGIIWTIIAIICEFVWNSIID